MYLFTKKKSNSECTKQIDRQTVALVQIDVHGIQTR